MAEARASARCAVPEYGRIVTMKNPSAAVLAAGVLLVLSAPVFPAPVQAAEPAVSGQAGSALEIPDDLSPEAANRPLVPEVPLEGVRYDDNGFPEDGHGILVVGPDGDAFSVGMRGASFPFLLYAQFVNRQRDAVILAREGLVQDTLPDGTMQDIPYGYGALKTTTAWISVVEGQLLPHLSDNQKTFEQFPLRDVYLGASLGITGLQAEARYVDRERAFGYARVGLNFLGGVGGDGLAPLNYTRLSVNLGGGIAFPGLLENLIGQNHWSVGGDLLLGFGDADGISATPSVVWMPGLFFELEKRDLFGWGNGWAGFGPHGDYHDDARPSNYHVRALTARVAVYLDLQNGAQTGWVKVDVGIGFRYNVAGPTIPAHPFKETRVVYMSDEYRQQVLQQRERREQRIQESGASP
jgi:hypothetical protein